MRLSRDRVHVDLRGEAADEEALEASLDGVAAGDLRGREVVAARGVHVVDEGDEGADVGADAVLEDVFGGEARALSLGHVRVRLSEWAGLGRSRWKETSAQVVHAKPQPGARPL